MTAFTTTQKTVAGMIHVPALPGTPHGELSVADMIPRVRAEARLYADAGIDAILVENMHDRPYLRGDDAGHEITAAMTVLAAEVKEASGGLPCGIQILAAANNQALACAVAAGLDLVRAEGFVFAHVADEGFIESDAARLLRYRRSLGHAADAVRIFTDIKKKHSSHAVTADLDIVETARAAELFLSDGLVVTGPATGREADLDEVRAVKEAVPSLPLAVGSGITPGNAAAYLAHADALIVGTAVKEDGDWRRPPDPARIRELLAALGR